MILSGRSMVLATASTTNLACCRVGQSNRLYRTVCLRVHRRSSSSANSTVVTLFFWLPEEELLKCFSKSVAAWFAVAFSPVSCCRDVTKLLSNYQCTSLIKTLLYLLKYNVWLLSTWVMWLLPCNSTVSFITICCIITLGWLRGGDYLASFPGPAQLSIACSAGPGNKSRDY